MAVTRLTELQQLSLDVYRGNVTGYSKEQGNDAIRKAILDAVGGEWSIYSFMDNKGKVFQIISEALSISMGTILIDQFNGFADVHDTELGDTKSFTVKNNDLFDVATIANGTNDLRRQKIYKNKLTVETEDEGVKIYEDLDLFIAGRIDWTEMVDRVAFSMVHKLGNRTYDAIYSSYASLSAPYQVSGAVTEAVLDETIGHVSAISGQKVAIYGTKKALAKITLSQYAESTKEDLNKLGYIGNYKGTPTFELPQVHKAGTNEFAIADDFLLIIPVGEKIVKIVLEGKPLVMEDTDGTSRTDRGIEFLITRKVGLGVMKASRYAIYKIV